MVTASVTEMFMEMSVCRQFLAALFVLRPASVAPFCAFHETT
jgi:hypothetical protein